MHNKTWGVHVGNVVGGGSVVNGMRFDLGSDADYNTWEQPGNPNWGHEGLAKYFKRSTHFDEPSESTRERLNITYDLQAYRDGPVKVSIPSFQYDDYKNIMGSFLASDLPNTIEGSSRPLGTFWTPNTIDNSTKERCHARFAYYDPVKGRPNLQLLTNNHVNEILFTSSSKLTASGVEFTNNAKASIKTVHATKEIILAAGGVFTPHLFMLSGVGPEDVLSAAKIPVKRNLPAVGSNFQDHQALYMRFQLSNQTIPNPDMLVGTTIDKVFNASAAAQYNSNRTGPWTFGRGNAAAFLTFKQFCHRYQNITSDILIQNATAYLPEQYKHNKSLTLRILWQTLSWCVMPPRTQSISKCSASLYAGTVDTGRHSRCFSDTLRSRQYQAHSSRQMMKFSTPASKLPLSTQLTPTQVVGVHLCRRSLEAVLIRS